MTSLLVSGAGSRGKSLLSLFQNLQVTSVRNKNHIRHPHPKNPIWFVKKNATKHDELLTAESKQIVQAAVVEKYGQPTVRHGIQTYENATRSLLHSGDVPVKSEFHFGVRRCGVIAKKIGIYPMWLKNGKRISSTLLQITDNHVVKYTPPEEFQPAQKPRSRSQNIASYGCLHVGALSTDPSNFTKEYCNLFAETGIMPKAILRRFIVSPEAALPPGTPLNVTHFRVGDYVDVRGCTVYRGFEGVMKRWGFHGQPRTHGQTKTHRRPGNIGGGGEKGRVWPGTKMPGHMGHRWRILKGCRILRINTKYNVMWVAGQNIAGDTNSFVYVFDTALPLKRKLISPPVPTALEGEDEVLEEYFHQDLHDFRDPTITFESKE